MTILLYEYLMMSQSLARYCSTLSWTQSGKDDDDDEGGYDDDHDGGADVNDMFMAMEIISLGENEG